MSLILNQIQRCMEKLVGKSTAEIGLNALLGMGAGYLMMRFAKSSALIVGIGLLVIELVTETTPLAIFDDSTLRKYFKLLLEVLTLDEVYRRCAARGFVGGMLIGFMLA